MALAVNNYYNFCKVRDTMMLDFLQSSLPLSGVKIGSRARTLVGNKLQAVQIYYYVKEAAGSEREWERCTFCAFPQI